MNDIVYNFPALFSHHQQMQHSHSLLMSLKSDMETIKNQLLSSWQGSGSQAYTVWQSQWDKDYHELLVAFSQLNSIFHDNIGAMMATESQVANMWS